MGAAGKIGEVGALVPDAYAAYELRMVAAMCFLLLQDYERGPARRLEEIESITALLRRGAELAPAALSSSLSKAIARSDERAGEMTMSALDERLDVVRGALIELQTWLEEAGTPEADALLGDVWAELRAGVRRRATALG
jgi:hypothetical protein